MKKTSTLLLFSVLYLGFLTRCESTPKTAQNKTPITQQVKDNEPPKLSIENLGAPPSLLNCTKKALYDIKDIDIATYDSVSSQYFQEVLDYEDIEAKFIENEISKLEYNLNSDAAKFYSDNQMDSIVNRLNQLKTDILSYDKILSGYVYVHTFTNKGDTLSAIIITNSDGSDAEAIQIKTVNQLDPDNYRSIIRP
jgi:AICAR transformylase/IMP cyclohydrolase PurH